MAVVNDVRSLNKTDVQIFFQNYFFIPKMITTSNDMFKREIWDKFQKMNEVKFPKISGIKMWFLVNHM